MPRLPQINKFKGDYSQSFSQWISQFEAHLKANGSDEAKYKDILLCCCEDAAFSAIMSEIGRDAAITYAGLKTVLSDKFTGNDYRRTLESKLRSTRFTKGMKITSFITELCQIIKELYNVTDETAIKSIAVSHVLSTLDSDMRDEIKILELTGNMKLENILELIQSKLYQNSLQHFSAHVDPRTNHSAQFISTANQNADPNNDIKELKQMMKLLLENQLLSQTSGVQHFTRKKTCSNCNKEGHLSNQCYKLKTCYICKRKGHISINCPNKDQPFVDSSAGEIFTQGCKNDLESVKRVMLKVNISGKDINFLYDPGSEYTILPKHLYDSLPIKPPLLPTDQFGIGINKSKFKFDGIAYLELSFSRQDGSNYRLQYEPILVSSDISQAIFGIHTEFRFQSVYRNHTQHELVFSPPDGHDDINVKYFSESKTGVNSAFIQVAKATIVKDQQITFLDGAVKGSKILENKHYVFAGTDGLQDLEFADIKFEGCINNPF